MTTFDKLIQKATPPSNTNIEKSTADDKRGILQQALRGAFKLEGECAHTYDVYYQDHDDEFLYFEIYNWEVCSYSYWRTSYTFTGTSASFPEEDPVEVIRLSNWTPVETDTPLTEKSAESLFKRLIKSMSTPSTLTKKQFSEDSNTSLEYLYMAADEVDGVGDAYYNSEEVVKMCDSANDAIEAGTLQSSYFHQMFTEDFTIIKAYVTEEETTFEETGVVVAKGQPLVEIQWNNPLAFEKRLSGDLMPPSIGATADIVDVSGNILKSGVSIIGKDALSELQEEGGTVGRLLKNISFQAEGSHIAMTEASQGGPCSLKEGMVLSKSNLKKKLSQAQQDLLISMGHKMEDINKSSNTDSSSSSESVDGEDTLNKGTENNMSEQEERIAALETQLAKAEATNALAKYELEDSDDLVKAYSQADTEGKTAILKTLDGFVAKVDAAIEKAKEETPSPLTKELGEDGTPEADAVPSSVDNINDIIKNTKGAL